MTQLERVPQPALPQPPRVFYARHNVTYWRVWLGPAGEPDTHSTRRSSAAYVARVVDFYAEAYSREERAWLVACRGDFGAMGVVLHKLGVTVRQAPPDGSMILETGPPSGDLAASPDTDGETPRSAGRGDPS